MDTTSIIQLSAESARAVLNGKAPVRERALALGRLVALRTKDHGQLAASYLRDEREELPLRVEAALALGRSEHPQRTKLLARELRDPHDAVRFAALRALGMHGGPEAFEAVRAVEGSLGDGYVQREAEHAKTLVAYRFGLAPGTLRPARAQPAKLDPKAAELVLSKRPLSAKAARTVSAGLGEVSVAIEPSSAWTYTLECGFHRLAVIMDRAFDAPGSLALLFKRKCVLLLVADEEYEPGWYAPSFHLLSHPGEAPGTVELNALDLRGRRIMTGVGREERGRLVFELKPLAVPGTFPMQLAGSFEPGGAGLSFSQTRASQAKLEPDGRRVPRRG